MNLLFITSIFGALHDKAIHRNDESWTICTDEALLSFFK